MEYTFFILTIITIIVISAFTYKIPFVTDNPMGLPIGSCIVLSVNDINIKHKYIKGSLAIDSFIKKDINPYIINLMQNHTVKLSGNITGIKSRIRDSYSIVWIEECNDMINIFDTDGVKLN